jgi:membrane fusion protein
VEVAAGAPLAVLRLSFDSTSGDTGKAIDRDLTDEEAANEAQARASHAKLAEQRTQLIASRASLAKELEEIERRTALLEQRQQLAEEQVARTSTLLSKGFVTAANVDSLRSAALSVAQDASETRASAVDYQRQIGDIDHQLAALPADIAALNAQAAQSRATLAQRRIVADTQSIYIASAPISGRVIAIPVEVGQAVPVGAAVAVITPEGSHLTAELYVPSRAAGFIRKGQEVSLMYQAFPYQTFGTGKGTVMSVSRTVLAPNEIAIPGLTVQEPVFRVRVALERAEVSAYGHAIPLQPGMLLTADVVIDRRNLIQWLLDPLYAVGRRT